MSAVLVLERHCNPQARYFGAALDDLGLKPRNPNTRIGPKRFEEWASRSAARG